MREAGEMLSFSSTDFFPPQLEGICCSNGLFFFFAYIVAHNHAGLITIGFMLTCRII